MSPAERHTRVREICEERCERPFDARTLGELEALLLDDPAAQAIYLKYVQLDTQLGLEFGGGQFFAASRAHGRNVAPSEIKSSGQAYVHQLANRRTTIAAVLAVAAALLLMVWWGQRDGPPQRAGAIAYLSADSQWRDQGSRLMVGQPLLTGDYELLAGEARLALDHGAMVHVTSPCRLALRHANRMSLERGQIEAYVPSSAAGFSVEIPGASVVDHGTRFAVNVQSDGTSQIHVHEGLVDVAPASADPPQTVAAGDAVRFNSASQQLTGIAFDQSLFADGQTLQIQSHAGDGKVVATGKVDALEWPRQRILRVGIGGPQRARSGCAMVYFFELPQLSHPSALEDAMLEFHYIGYQDPKPRSWGPKLKEFQVDLTALGTRMEPSVRSTDYADGPLQADSTATLIQHNFVNAGTKPGVQQLRATAHAAFVRYLREQAYRPDGTPTGRYLAVRLSPNVEMPRGNYEIRGFVFSESECSFPGDQPPQLTLRVAGPRE